MRELTLGIPNGRTLHAYDTGEPGDDRIPVVWHHGTPNIGTPPKPLFADADRLGIRWVSYNRPGYGGSTPHPGRDIASAASDVASLADALVIDRFATIGHSGGGPHALGCAALLPDRVQCVVSASGPAPFEVEGLDWFAGMGPSSAASLRAASQGRAAKERYEASGADPEPDFIAADWEALSGAWSWFHDVVRPAMANGPGALIDDDLATVAPWGFDPVRIQAPALFLHGTEDRMIPSSHGEWLAMAVPSAELRLVPGAGHISVLHSAPAALEWLCEHFRGSAL
ncbi:MAG: alpha/beta hydrolase [Chloroflexi bacterium]|nr:alpha/beta hydrolase [Chloroflexota bacterium]